MSPPVNLTNLREITGGDHEIEQELFVVFLESAQVCLKGLRDSLADTDHVIWRKQAHALKGISYNLGAQLLGDLCKMAQDDSTTSQEQKTQLLTAIEGEYGLVESYLKDLKPAG
jgi:HPt (histidine-containing phosphotransfer) domain-containing protein